MNGKKLIFSILVLLFLFSSCQKNQTANLSLMFNFCVDGNEITFDQMKYHNAAGNLYEVNEIMFFVSNLVLYKSDGTQIAIDGVHYVDADRRNSLAWGISKHLPEGEYEAISFTFGLSDAENRNFRFVNPPECDMSWPMVLGGGYHYLKINGKWMANDTLKPFNFHMGRGQVRDAEGNITDFIDNSFQVTINQHYRIKQKDCVLQLLMDVNQWFGACEVFDLDEWGGSIMENQDAQELLKKNGSKVFSVRIIN